MEPEKKDGKNGASPLTLSSGPRTTFSNPGEEGMDRGQSRRSDAGLGDRKSECVAVLSLMTKLTLGIGGLSCKCGIDEMTSLGPSSSYTP